jgi:hypothetical protein
MWRVRSCFWLVVGVERRERERERERVVLVLDIFLLGNSKRMLYIY